MDLKEILSVSGKAGLFKVIAQTKNGAIVESLVDKKRFPVFTTDKISSLADISVFCEEGDMPLKEILKRIHEKETAQPVMNIVDDAKKLKTYFEEVLPEYNREKVYVSDMKKIIVWYNLLLEKEMLKFEEEVVEDEKVEETASVNNEEEIEQKKD